MNKLSDYSQEEIEAVKKLFYPNNEYKPNEEGLMNMMNSLSGSQLVLSMRVRKFVREMLKAFRLLK